MPTTDTTTLNDPTLEILRVRASRVLGNLGVTADGANPSLFLRRISSEIARHGRPQIESLLNAAEHGAPAAIQTLRGLLTVKYSRFWREPAHWPILAEHLRLRFRAGLPVSIWSAACARGEEAYTIAMVADDTARAVGAPAADWRVLATDVDAEALAAAAAAQYPAAALGDLPRDLRRRHLSPSREGWTVDNRVRNHVTFASFDLECPVWQAPADAPFDVIFLANVLIYLDRTVARRVLEQAAALLKPDGILLTSRSESHLQGPRSRLKSCGDVAYILAADARSTQGPNR